MIKRTTKIRKKKDAIFDEDGNAICPHCKEKTTFRKYNYGRLDGEDGGYFFKKICFNCDHYVMFYTNSEVERIVKDDANIENPIERDTQGCDANNKNSRQQRIFEF